MQATQNGSDLWLSYWVSHTHKERYEGAWTPANGTGVSAGPRAHRQQLDEQQQWLSMGSVQALAGPVSQCFLWAQQAPLLPEARGSSRDGEPASRKEVYREQAHAPAAAAEEQRVVQAGPREAGAPGGGTWRGLRARWAALVAAVQQAWAAKKRRLHELQPDVQLYLAVLLLLAAANSLFILVLTFAPLSLLHVWQ